MIREKDRLIVKLLTDLHRRPTELPHAADHMIFHIRQFLRCLPGKAGPCLRAQFQMVLLRYAKGVLTGGDVRRRWPRRDHIQGIPEYVRQNHTVHPGRGTPLTETASFDPGQAFADRVHLHDIRPAGQKLGCDILQLLQWNQRLLKEGAPSSRQKKQHGIFGLQVFRHIQYSFRGFAAVFIWQRMPRLIARNSRDLPHHMMILRHDHAGLRRLTETFYRRVSHLPGSLSHRHQIHSAGKLLSRQTAPHRLVGLYRLQRPFHYHLRIFPQTLFHNLSFPPNSRPFSHITIIIWIFPPEQKEFCGWYQDFVKKERPDVEISGRQGHRQTQHLQIPPHPQPHTGSHTDGTDEIVKNESQNLVPLEAHDQIPLHEPGAAAPP